MQDYTDKAARYLQIFVHRAVWDAGDSNGWWAMHFRKCRRPFPGVGDSFVDGPDDKDKQHGLKDLQQVGIPSPGPTVHP